jgi:hypothetical protein
MISTEIYIEDYKLDLLQDISTEFSYSIDDIVDFGSRNTSFSKTINISGTAINNKIFGFVFDLGNANFTDDALPNVNYNFNASKSAQCRIFIDKIQVFKGTLRILEIVIDGKTIEYQCSVFGELGGFISSLGNNRIEDLDFSFYDHTYTHENITASWEVSGARGTSNSTAYGSGYYYPLIDYGNVSTDKLDYNVMTFRPALFVKQYIEKIFAGSGYTYDFPLLDTDAFKRLIIPHNQKILSTISNVQLTATPIATTYTGSGITIPLGFTNTTLGSFTYAGTTYIYTGASKVINLDFKLIGLYTAGGIATLNVKKAGVTIGSYYIGAPFPGHYFTANINLVGITFNTSDSLTFSLDWTSASTGYNLVVQSGGSLSLTTTSSDVVPVNYNEAIKINSTIPKGIFQRDFFLSICKMFNLYVYDDIYTDKKIYIKPYIDFYSTGSSTSLDWSNKIDRSKPLSIKPMSELNARYYQFKYKDDTDNYNENYKKKYNENYGDRLYDTAYDFSKDTDTLEVIFASSPLVQATGRDKRVTQILKISDNNTKEQSVDSVIRIMQVQKITGVASWNIKNQAGSSNLVTGTAYGYAGHLHFNDAGVPDNDLNFGAPKEVYITATSYPTTNLFNAYYSDYIAEITSKDSKLLTCSALLNTIDINTLDFSKHIWIDGVLFKLNNIIGYNPMEYNTTKVSLLKVIETNEPPVTTTTTSTTTTTTTAATSTTTSTTTAGTSTTTSTTTGGGTTTTTTTIAPTTTTTSTTTTTTTLPPVTYDFSATCTGITQTITISNFAGGDGTNYYANVVTYGDAGSAAAGATSLVTGGVRTYTGQPNGTRYVYVSSGSRSLVKNGGNTCTTTTSTTTTTTTIQQVWYQLANCNGGGTVYSTNYDIGYAAVNDRVFGTVSGVPSTLTVTSVLFSNPGGTQIGIVNSGQTGCPATTTTTTTTTTQAPVNANISSVCTGVTQTITVDSFSGGDGSTYYASDTTYGDPASAAAGAVSLVSSGTRSYASQPNGTRYVKITSTIRENVLSGGQTCTTTTTSTTTTTTTVAVWSAAVRMSKLSSTTGSVTLYESSDGVTFNSIASRTTNGITLVSLQKGYYYYITTIRLTCTGSCSTVAPQSTWSYYGVTYGPNVGGAFNGSSVDSDVIQTATSGVDPNYDFIGYINNLV